MGKKSDYSIYINTKHGQLTINTIYKKEREYVADCLCDCGNTTTGTSLTKLLKGQRNSCKSCSSKLNGNKGNISRANTSKYNELVGKQIHYFTVLGRSKEHPGCFECRCVCGNIRHLDANALTTSDQKSCGCKQSMLLSLAAGGTGIAGENTPTNEYIRKNTPEYIQWVKDCLKKANYTCAISGKHGVAFHVHHLIPLSTLIALHNITKENYLNFKNILFDVNNGVVLCEDLHKDLHNECGKITTLENFIVFKYCYKPKH